MPQSFSFANHEVAPWLTASLLEAATPRVLEILLLLVFSKKHGLPAVDMAVMDESQTYSVAVARGPLIQDVGLFHCLPHPGQAPAEIWWAIFTMESCCCVS